MDTSTRVVREQMMAAGFPMADPVPPVNTITQPCGCAFLVQGEDEPVQVGWCAGHDPGYPEEQ